MDSKKETAEALPRASNFKEKEKQTKTLLVHPFQSNEIDLNKTNNKNYLLETPKVNKRKTPLLELPIVYQKPKRFDAINKNTQRHSSPDNTRELDNNKNSTQQCCSSQHKCKHCCCSANKCGMKHAESCRETMTCDGVQSCCSCKNVQPLKVIFTPAMMPTMHSMLPVNAIPYIIKASTNNEKVSHYNTLKFFTTL